MARWRNKKRTSCGSVVTIGGGGFGMARSRPVTLPQALLFDKPAGSADEWGGHAQNSDLAFGR
jgi:hypothetical protein